MLGPTRARLLSRGCGRFHGFGLPKSLVKTNLNIDAAHARLGANRARGNRLKTVSHFHKATLSLRISEVVAHGNFCLLLPRSCGLKHVLHLARELGSSASSRARTARTSRLSVVDSGQ